MRKHQKTEADNYRAVFILPMEVLWTCLDNKQIMLLKNGSGSTSAFRIYTQKGIHQVLIVGQAAKELYETFALMCVHKIRKVKVLELMLLRDFKDTRNPTSMLVARVDAGLLEENS